MLRKLAAATLAVVFGMSFIAVEPASAVTHGRSSRRAEKVRTGIVALGTGTDARISLKVRGGARYSGYVSSASETSFVVTDLLTGVSSDIQ